MIEIRQGDCRAVLAEFEAESFSAVVTDPPYHLVSQDKRPATRQCPHAHRRVPSGGFMGQAWDGGDVAFQPETWSAVYRVLKPGAHLLAFGGTRTYHRLVCAIEDAGFEIRDTIMWLYGSGFPKSHDVSKALDRAAGAERTEVVGVKPGHEDFVARTDAHAAGGRSDGWERPWREDSGAVARSHLALAPATGAAREWQGWGTAVKPAAELVCVARKPSADVTSDELRNLTGWDHWCSSKSDGEDKILTARALHPETRSYRARIDKEGREVSREDLGAYEPFAVDAVAANVLRHGTGAINIDASRVATVPEDFAAMNGRSGKSTANNVWGDGVGGSRNGTWQPTTKGRWPANVCHDGSPEVMEAFARFGSSDSLPPRLQPCKGSNGNDYGTYNTERQAIYGYGDTGTVARFFFCAKADASERVSNHPTVKPVAFMEWLVRLVCPNGGLVLDPFAGTGSTLVACDHLGFDALGIEQDAQTVADAHEKLRRMRARRMIGDAERVPVAAGQLGLFG